MQGTSDNVYSGISNSIPKLLSPLTILGRRLEMRRSLSKESQGSRKSELKRLKELEQENGLLKFLYEDLMQKFSAMKEGLTRSAGAC